MATTVIDTPIGPLALTAGRLGLTRVEFGPLATVPDPDVGTDPGGADEAREHLLRAADELEEYLAGSRRTFTVALDRTGRTGFRGAVLTALEQVPYGEVVTYGELAEEAGRPGAARAVGTTMATNPLPIVVPCHRVTRRGSVGRYGPGVRTKLHLLDLEGALPVR